MMRKPGHLHVSRFPNVSQYAMPPWWPLLELLLWCPIFESSHSNSFEDQTPVDFVWSVGSLNELDGLECKCIGLLNYNKHNKARTTMTSSNGNICALLALCEGNPSVTGGSPLKGQWLRALLFSLICPWTNGWTNNPYAGDLRRHRAHYDFTVLTMCIFLGMYCR